MTRPPSMPEHQAVQSYQDAVRRLRMLGFTVENRRSPGADRAEITVTEPQVGDEPPQSETTTIVGCEGKGATIATCFTLATQWLEEHETRHGRMSLISVLNRLSGPGGERLDQSDAMTLRRAKLRYAADGQWMDLDRAYLHRVYLWPQTTAPNRQARRRHASEARAGY